MDFISVYVRTTGSPHPPAGYLLPHTIIPSPVCVTTREQPRAARQGLAIGARMLLASCYLCILAAMAGGPFVARNGRMYRTPQRVLGDPGMRRAQKGKGISETTKRPVGPRMQLFFYSLCSKAMPANFTVIPRASDTCSAPWSAESGPDTYQTQLKPASSLVAAMLIKPTVVLRPRSRLARPSPVAPRRPA